MRLLRRRSDDDFELVTFTDEIPPYAILSHTWTDSEVTYNELVANTGRDKAGYAKILFCVNQAAEDGLEYSWVDTCCIDKSTSDELSTAINSMFRWYQRATKCYVYLSDVHVSEEVPDVQAFRITWIDAFRRSRWFTRGWTLQELIAPAHVEFFSVNCKKLGSKISLEDEIHEVTKVPTAALRGQRLSEFSVDERMSWARKRMTKVQEDKAYCLLGIFGVFMPLIYGEGEEHALSRLKREMANTSNPQPVRIVSSNVPFAEDYDFVNRGDILARVDERCLRPAGRAALVGFGGFGKSQLAIEYAHRARRNSPNSWVFWVHASNSARLEEGFDNIAEKVGLSSQMGTAPDIVSLVLKWLSNPANGRWLLILDNVDEEITIESKKEGRSISLASLLPQSEHGAILITSRNTDVARSLVNREQDIIKVSAMSEGEAVQLLCNKLAQPQQDGAAQLVKALDCIPLAIVQAAAYINRLGPRMSAAKYFDELGGVEKQVQLLQKPAPDIRRDGEALNSVLATWEISFKHIREKRRSAARLLSFISFFNPQGIPEFMVRHYSDRHEQDDLSDEYSEEEVVDFEEDMAMLRAFCLIGMTRDKDKFEMHRLVQLATRMWLKSTGAESKWHGVFIRAMSQEFPNGEYENWATCQTLFPHVLPEIENEGVGNRKTTEWAILFRHAGWYAWRQGLFTQAENMVSSALDVQREVLGAEDGELVLSESLLGSIYEDLGRYQEAEKIYRQTLATSESLYGADHSFTLANKNNLAQKLVRQGKYDEAELMLRETLAIREKVLGYENAETLTTMDNLALVLGRQAKYEEAEAMHRKTLSGIEKVLGMEHPDTLMAVYGFAYLLADLKRYDEATTLYKRACAGYTSTLGRDHPTTRECHRNYKRMLSAQEKQPVQVPQEVPSRNVTSTTEKQVSFLKRLTRLRFRRSKG